VSLFKRGRIWWCDFFVAGKRYRCSTKQKTESKARQYESTLMADIRERGPAAVPDRAPTLREYSSRFLYWVTNTDQLGRNTRKYYRFGWERLKDTPLAGMRLDAITTDAVSLVPFPGSAAWGNQARRTLRVMLGKAVRDNLIRQAPRIHLVNETGRDGILDDATEAKLLAVARQPLKDVLLIMRDMGLRPAEVFRMRWEHVHWDKRLYFNPYGKSRKARRWVPLSQRVFDALKLRAGNKSDWVFPSRRAIAGHLTTVAKQFREARSMAGLPKGLVLYHARHAFGTYAMAQTKNPALVRDVMGHADLRTTMIYQHPELEPLREAIDGRNKERVM
jgi:integrase